MSGIILTDANFEEEVLKSELPVLVDFYADWCGPCKLIAPVLDELGKEYAGKLKIGKLNVDENNVTSAKYGVMSIPTLLFVKNGEVQSSLVGFRPKEKLVEEINKII
jgi:thioredoxin 1